MSNVGAATARAGQVNSSNINSTQAADEAAGSSKPAAASANQEPEAAKGGSDPRGKIAEHQLEGQVMKAMAEKQMNPVGPHTSVDITNKEMRNQLMRSCPQINPISNAAGNGPGLCGAAAVTNALVMSSKTPDQAKANAKAIRDLAGSFPTKPVKLSAAEDAALKHMEAGKMSPTDVQHVQQVIHRIADNMPNGGINVGNGGLSTVQVAGTMSLLAKRGAFQGSSVTMHCNSMNEKFNHWTTTVDGIHANSQGPNDKSFVQGGPPANLARGTKGWENELWLNANNQPAELHFQVKGDGDESKKHRYALVDPSKYDVMNLSELDWELRTNTRKSE